MASILRCINLAEKEYKFIHKEAMANELVGILYLEMSTTESYFHFQKSEMGRFCHCGQLRFLHLLALHRY